MLGTLDADYRSSIPVGRYGTPSGGRRAGRVPVLGPRRLHHRRDRRHQRRLPHRLEANDEGLRHRPPTPACSKSLVGARRQLGGVDLITFEEGHARGTRALDVRTGSGLRFQVLPDRGLGHRPRRVRRHGALLAAAEGPRRTRGTTRATMTTTPGCASASAGSSTPPGSSRWGPRRPCSTEQYGFTQRLRRPLRHARPHRRNPREHVNHGEQWDGDRLVLWAEGTVRQDIAYGENLALARRYEIDAGTSRSPSATRSPTRASSPRRTRSSTTSTSASRSCGGRAASSPDLPVPSRTCRSPPTRRA